MPTGQSRDLAHQLSRAERLLTGRMSAILHRENCTLEEWRVLKILADGRGHAMTEIADFAMLPAPEVADLVDRLVSEGLLYRREHGPDTLAYLSLQGRDRYESAGELLSAAEAELGEALGDQGQLAGWLDRLYGVLSVPAQAGPPESSQSPASA